MKNLTITYIFILLLIMILVAYYAGAVTDTQAAANGLGSLFQTLTGRNSQNQFAAYPGNAPSVG